MAEKFLYPGTPDVINGNGAVAYVMKHVCDGVIGYPITPSTEISELFEAARADGVVNVWGRHPFFFEAEGEHSAQGGALGAALTGGHYISNASSSQGILYAMESHFVTAGKKIGGFVLQVAARVVTKHSLNVMAGHDDVYALLPSGYTILFGSNPQEAADLAAISYRVSALSLIPVANSMDGFATSHMLSEVNLPEPALLRDYLGDPSSRIPCPTVAQELLLGAKGRVFQLGQYLERHEGDLEVSDHAALTAYLTEHADQVEADGEGALVDATLGWLPEDLHAPWRRQWVNAWQKGTRQLVPALVDPDNPGLTGPVQNQPDFQAGAVDHRTHFAAAVPALIKQAMDEYAALTGRKYEPVQTYSCDDADLVMVGMGSVTDDVRAVLPYLRSQGLKVGVVSVKQLQPFPEAELAAALAGAKAVMVLERSDDTALTRLVTQALFKARSNADDAQTPAFPGIPAMDTLPRLTTAIFGLGGHDLQPRHLVAAAKHMADGTGAPLVYLGSQFFSDDPTPQMAAIQERLRAAYPETELMALETEPNPVLLPPGALRLRFHSVGGYGTVATGKLLTDILAGVLGMYSKSAPKYGSEKSGAATNYYITLSPEPVLITNAELEDVEVVISPDHQVFVHTNPLKGLVEGGTFIMQSSLPPAEVWRSLPAHARRTIREKKLRFLTVDAFAVAKEHAPTAALETRMMGIAFIGAVVAHVDRVSGGASLEAIQSKVREQIVAKFGRKGERVVEGNMAVIRDGMTATQVVDYDAPEILAVEEESPHRSLLTVALSASMCPSAASPRPSALFDPGYYEDLAARPFREGTISEAPVLPGSGLFMPPGTALGKDKGVFRREIPLFDPAGCTGCLECTMVCPDAAIPTVVHEIHDLILEATDRIDVTAGQRDALRGQAYLLAERARESYRQDKTERPFSEVVAEVAASLDPGAGVRPASVDALVARLATYPVARTRPFFDAAEKATPGTGGLLGVVVDPWKCTGCLQCVDVCGPKVLTRMDQDDALEDMLEQRFETMTHLPSTPQRFVAGAASPEGDIKRLLLDRENYYTTTGGHGACRGCGEVTAIRLMTSLSHALGTERRRTRERELGTLVTALRDKMMSLPAEDADRRERIASTVATLESALYRLEGGPTGNGPSSTVIANATGCSSVYSSTMPFTQYLDPWVNGLFQDAQPLAKGIFEGISAGTVPEIRAERVARMELEDAYDPAVHDKDLTLLTWQGFTPEEMGALPTVITLGGDGASYDIGFGAMSRVLTSRTPVKVMVLDTGAYSNTGGQASTASFVGQDSDLARFGGAHGGKTEQRKELALLASFHPGVFACSTSTALHGHFLSTSLSYLGYGEGAAMMNVYTPCSTENGIAEDLSNARSRLAVESRVTPLFVHDPRKGATLAERFSLDGNPDVDADWTTSTIEYVDESGTPQLMETPLTPAEFALGEGRFAKHFKRLPADQEDRAVPVHEFVDLAVEDRADKVPFVYATDDDRHLIKIRCAGPIIDLVEDRRHYWRTLQDLAGLGTARLTAAHKAEVADLQARYEEAAQARETSLDDIARAMSDLATSSAAPSALGGLGAALGGALGGGAPAAAPPAAGGAPDRAGAAGPDLPIYLDPADVPLCNDCGTCYQDLPQFFEKATMMIDGESRVVGRMIPGSTDGVEITPELQARITRVRDNCDAEIIR